MAAGNPPKYWDPQRPCGSVIYAAARDRDYREDHFEKPCRKVNLQDAAEAAAQQHSDFSTPMNIDEVAEFMYGFDYDGAMGPYTRRTPGAPARGQIQCLSPIHI